MSSLTPTCSEDSPWEGAADLAYIITTSGSAGTPKPVFVRHASVVPNIRDCADEFRPAAGDEILAASPITFDPSILDLFLVLVSGASLVLLPRRLKQQGPGLYDALFTANRVSLLQCTPGLLTNIFSGSWELPVSLKTVAVGGEQCRVEAGRVLQRLVASSRVRVYHLYGLTEMSIWQSLVRISEAEDALCPPIFVRERNLLTETEISCPESEVVVTSRTRHCCQMLICSCCRPYTVRTGDLAIWQEGKLFWKVGIFFFIHRWTVASPYLTMRLG